MRRLSWAGYYSGTIDHFQGRMTTLMKQAGGDEESATWTSSDGQPLHILLMRKTAFGWIFAQHHSLASLVLAQSMAGPAQDSRSLQEISTYARLLEPVASPVSVWYVSDGRYRRAMIEATEVAPNVCQVTFIDGGHLVAAPGIRNELQRFMEGLVAELDGMSKEERQPFRDFFLEACRNILDPGIVVSAFENGQLPIDPDAPQWEIGPTFDAFVQWLTGELRLDEQQPTATPSPATADEGARDIAAGSGPLREESLVKEISWLFATLRGYAEDMGIAGLYDFNVIAQDFIAKLLNLVFGWRLINMDYLHRNQPGIDLGDHGNGIAVQVTAERERRKIQNTIDAFTRCELDKQYPRLYFFILTRKRRYREPFDTGERFSFTVSEHVMDFTDLLRNIRPKPIGEIAEIRRFLAEQIRAPLTDAPASVSVLKKLLDELPTIETLDFDSDHSTFAAT
jgi:hypothetical protein